MGAVSCLPLGLVPARLSRRARGHETLMPGANRRLWSALPVMRSSKPWSIAGPWLLSLLMLSAPGPGWTQATPALGDAAEEVALEPSEFVALALRLSRADPASQWAFASLTLDALLDAYRRELQLVAAEQQGRPADPRKLERWRRGTQDMVRRLEALRHALGSGAALGLHVDARHRVTLLVGGQPIPVSGPRIEIEPEIERQVVERFCAANDCSAPDAPAPQDDVAPTTAAQGLWVLSQGEGAVYEMVGQWRCRFSSLADRERKATTCQQAVDELKAFAGALEQARAQGYRIEWDRLEPPVRAGGQEMQVVLNADGAFVRLSLPLLARVHQEDWQRVVSWLRQSARQTAEILQIEQADSLLESRFE